MCCLGGEEVVLLRGLFWEGGFSREGFLSGRFYDEAVF
jgi:hypothetical protein